MSVSVALGSKKSSTYWEIRLRFLLPSGLAERPLEHPSFYLHTHHRQMLKYFSMLM